MADQSAHHRMQIEAPVESICKRTEVAMSVLAELECLVRAGDHRLDVAEDSVDPGELREISRLAVTDDHPGVCAVRIDNSCEARQSVAEYVAAGLQIGLGPCRDRLAAKRGDGVELDAQGMAFFAQRHGRYEGNLVRRSSTPYAGALTPKIGVVNLNIAVKPVACVTLRHRQKNLLVHQPSCPVVDAKMSLQGQCRQTRLGLADQENCQEPCTQGQLCAVHHRARCQRSLVAAHPALVKPSGVVLHDVVSAGSTARAAKAARPAAVGQSRGALGFAAIAVNELVHGHPALKLDTVDRHGCIPEGWWGQLTGPLAHSVSLA